MAWFQNDFIEMFLISPFTKIAKNGSALLNEMVTRAKNKKKTKKKQKNNNKKTLNDISVASGNISK